MEAIQDVDRETARTHRDGGGRGARVACAHVNKETSSDPFAAEILERLAQTTNDIYVEAMQDVDRETAQRVVTVVDAVLASRLRSWLAGRITIATVSDDLADAIGLLLDPESGAVARCGSSDRALVVQRLVGLGREVHATTPLREHHTGTRRHEDVVALDGPQFTIARGMNSWPRSAYAKTTPSSNRHKHRGCSSRRRSGAIPVVDCVAERSVCKAM